MSAFCSRRSATQPAVSATPKTLTSLVVLSLLVLALFCMPVASLLAQTPTPVTVPTWRYDLTHAGQNTSETALTPANVNVNSFGKLFSLPVDGTLYSQPLYVPRLTMSDGLVHNVVFVATGHDSVYAFDADSNGGANANPIWQVSLLSTAHGAGAGATTIPWQDTASPDVAPEIGITGTPTINPATNTLYVVAATKENGVYFSRLHALNILTGAEQANSPVAISATLAGTGNGSTGGQLSFSPLWQNQRSALNYFNGYVYFGYGAHGDNGPWHGWIFAYNATTLAQSAVVLTSPNGYGAGVWEAGAGMPIDDDAQGGRMFVALGNGSASAYPPFTANIEMGESIVDFNLANGGLTPTDAFTSFNADKLNDGDLDQGSGGVLMVPDQQGAYPHVLVQSGKEGRILVLNRDQLGGNEVGEGSNESALQDIPGEIKGLWSTPAYWNGNVYTWGENDVPKLFTMNSGVLSTEPVSQSTITSAFPGASFSVSSNGAQDGVAWAVRSDQFNSHGPAVLYAWEATDLTNTIYESDTNAKRDAAAAANKFSIPMVTNGKVYVACNGQLDVYGLFNAEPNAVAPVITPNGGAFPASQNVTLSTTTASASIYYTLDGTVPTPASTLYTGPITITTDTTVNAIASAAGYVQSGVSSATFTFTTQAPAVSFLPAPGTYTTAQQITLSDTDSTAKIYYTTDGSTPTAASNLYTAPIAVAASTTINAIAIDPTLVNSNVASGAYVIQTGQSINFGSGFSSTAGLTLNGNAVATDDSRLQLTNGQLLEASSVFWNTPIGVQSFTTNFEFQLSLAQGDGFTFTIQGIGPTALGGNSGGLGYAGIGKSVAIKFDFYNDAGEGNDSTGVFTNGALPTVPAVDLTPSGIELNSGDSIAAQITYDGTTLTMNLLDLVTNKTFTLTQAINIPQIVGGNTAYVGFTGGTGGLTSSQKILTWTYATSASALATSAPTFMPAAGTYSAPQSVTLSDATAGALIYYTTDGTAPTTTSAAYNAPIAVGVGTTTIQAIALATGASQSAVATATYVVTLPVTAAPTFSPVAGTYTAAEGVTLADGTPGAVIYYTTDGTTPTTSSAVYSTPIQVAATETLTAIAGAPNVQTSSPATAVYTINLPAPGTFTLSATPTTAVAQGASATSTISITPSGSFTGSVALSCAVTPNSSATATPTCSIVSPATITGTAAGKEALTINTLAATSPGAYTVTVTGTSGSISTTTSVAVTVSAPSVAPSFTLTNTAISITSPGTNGTSTITVTPSGGFTGSVALTCAVTASPSGAVDMPTCSTTAPAAISGTGPVTATLTISTTAASTPATGALHNPLQRIFTFSGSGALAALLFFGLPIRRRGWKTLLSLLVFSVIAGAAIGCNGMTNTPGGSTTGTTNNGTTTGSYTVTVIGTSGSTTATTAVTVTVN
jgi:hypothetical protein